MQVRNIRHPVWVEDLARVTTASLPWQQLRDAKILVTGAYGMLAGHLVESLLAASEVHGLNLHIVGLVRSAARAKQRFGHRKNLSYVVSDFTRRPALPNGLTHIIHAASPASPKRFNADPIGTITPNLWGTWHMLEAARASGARLLFISSGEVYGTVSADQIPISERSMGTLDPATVRACYGESKRMAETLCVAWHHQHGVHAVVARPFHTYGPGMSLQDGRVFADFVGNIVRGENIVLKSSGTAIRPFCYVSDATRGFLHTLLQGEPGTPYNVGNEQATIAIRDLAERLVALFPDRGLQVVYGDHAPGYLESPIPSNAPDTSRLRALGWQPDIGIDEGFFRTVQSFS